MARLEGKVAIVTGAGSGIGKSIAQLFAEEGAKVVCADRSGQEEEVAAGIGSAALAIRTDVSISADVQAMIAAAERHFGRLDILCNNAGFGGPIMKMAEQSEETWDAVHAVNLRAVFLGMKYGIEAMLRTGGGAIVNTASTVALSGYMGLAVYAAAKAGVIQLTKTAALDYAQDNIRINAICPGHTWTGLVPMAKDNPVPPPGTPAPPGAPMMRWGLPIELANAALFLASDEASLITGVALPVDGGYAIGGNWSSDHFSHQEVPQPA